VFVTRLIVHAVRSPTPHHDCVGGEFGTVTSSNRKKQFQLFHSHYSFAINYYNAPSQQILYLMFVETTMQL